MGRPVPKTTLPYPVTPYWNQGFQFFAGAKMIDVTERTPVPPLGTGPLGQSGVRPSSTMEESYRRNFVGCEPPTNRERFRSGLAEAIGYIVAIAFVAFGGYGLYCVCRMLGS